jgi:hypothetical protein
MKLRNKILIYVTFTFSHIFIVASFTKKIEDQYIIDGHPINIEMILMQRHFDIMPCRLPNGKFISCSPLNFSNKLKIIYEKAKATGKGKVYLEQLIKDGTLLSQKKIADRQFKKNTGNSDFAFIGEHIDIPYSQKKKKVHFAQSPTTVVYIK